MASKKYCRVPLVDPTSGGNGGEDFESGYGGGGGGGGGVMYEPLLDNNTADQQQQPSRFSFRSLNATWRPSIPQQRRQAALAALLFVLAAAITVVIVFVLPDGSSGGDPPSPTPGPPVDELCGKWGSRLGWECPTAITVEPYGRVWYVTSSSPSSGGNGSSWQTAFSTLSAALAVAEEGDEVWVTTGVYYPTDDGNRSKSFVLVPGVAVFGGFQGDERERHERSLDPSLTWLSGDIGNPGDNSDNSFHVVLGADAAAVDGVTIAFGAADGSEDQDKLGLSGYGGGMLSLSPDEGGFFHGFFPVLVNVVFRNNTAREGGAMYNWNAADPDVSDCLFEDNVALASAFSGGNGGAIMNRDGSCPVVRNTVFRRNSADLRGGAIYSDYGSEPCVSGCLFVDNWSGGHGGAFYVDDRASQWGETCPSVIGTTFRRNHADGRGGAIENFNKAGTNFDQCEFVDNSANECGGGVSNFYMTAVTSGSRNSWSGNSAGAACNGTDADDEFTEQGHWAYSGDSLPEAPSDLDMLAELWATRADTAAGTGGSSGRRIVFVDGQRQGGTRAGESWDDAFTDLQSGIDDAADGAQSAGTPNEVWVAAGIYYPTSAYPSAFDDRESCPPADCASQSSDTRDDMMRYCALTCCENLETCLDPRLLSFEMRENVSIYGGFNGTEAQRHQRDWKAHVTVLSGNLGDAASAADNALHVLWSANNSLVDGFVIREGNAADSIYEEGTSGAQHMSPWIELEMSAMTSVGANFVARQTGTNLSNSVVSGGYAGKAGGAYFIGFMTDEPTLRDENPWKPADVVSVVDNCAIVGNAAMMRGGGISLDLSPDVTFKKTIFDSNIVGGKGGGLYNDFYSSPQLFGCEFRNNEAVYATGGGMGNDGTSLPLIENTAFVGNRAGDSGGGIHQGSYNATKYHEGLVTPCNPTLINCTFSGNVVDNGNKDIYNWHMDIPVLDAPTRASLDESSSKLPSFFQ